MRRAVRCAVSQARRECLGGAGAAIAGRHRGARRPAQRCDHRRARRGGGRHSGARGQPAGSRVGRASAAGRARAAADERTVDATRTRAAADILHSPACSCHVRDRTALCVRAEPGRGCRELPAAGRTRSADRRRRRGRATAPERELARRVRRAADADRRGAPALRHATGRAAPAVPADGSSRAVGHLVAGLADRRSRSRSGRGFRHQPAGRADVTRVGRPGRSSRGNAARDAWGTVGHPAHTRTRGLVAQGSARVESGPAPRRVPTARTVVFTRTAPRARLRRDQRHLRTAVRAARPLRRASAHARAAAAARRPLHGYRRQAGVDEDGHLLDGDRRSSRLVVPPRWRHAGRHHGRVGPGRPVPHQLSRCRFPQPWRARLSPARLRDQVDRRPPEDRRDPRLRNPHRRARLAGRRAVVLLPLRLPHPRDRRHHPPRPRGSPGSGWLLQHAGARGFDRHTMETGR